MRKLFLILFVSVSLISCKEDETANIATVNSVYVIHEGNFGSSNANIGVYNLSDSSYQQTAFESTNGYFIGDVQQDVKVSNGLAYSVLNGSGKIEVFNLENLQAIETISSNQFDKPRYMTIDGDFAYITVWGPYDESFNLTDSKILKVDLISSEVVSSINTEPGVEQIKAVEGKLYVTRNYYGAYNHVTIIDIATESILADLRIASGPDEIFVDYQGKVWVVCSSGTLVEIGKENNNVVQSISLNNEIFSDVEYYDGLLYYLQEGMVKRINLNSLEGENLFQAPPMEIPYAFGINPANGDIFIGDGVAYGSEGVFYHFTSEGVLVKEFTSGIFPTQFVFQ